MCDEGTCAYRECNGVRIFSTSGLVLSVRNPITFIGFTKKFHQKKRVSCKKGSCYVYLFSGRGSWIGGAGICYVTVEPRASWGRGVVVGDEC